MLSLRVVRLPESQRARIRDQLIKEGKLCIINRAAYVHSIGRLDTCSVQIPVAENITVLDLIHQFPVVLMGDDVQRINIFIAGNKAEGQAQASADGLHGEDVALRRIQGNDGEQVVDVPAFLQFVDVQHNFNRVLRLLDGEQQAHVLLGFFTLHVGMNLDNLTFVSPVQEAVAVNEGADVFRVIRVFAGN